MKNKIKNEVLLEFNESVEHYKKMVLAGENDSAAKEIAKAHYFLRDLDGIVKEEEKVFVNVNVQRKLQDLENIVVREKAKLRQIVSYGKKFAMEEFIQIFTLRLEVELMVRVLKLYFTKLDCEDISELDVEIKIIGKNNQKEFNTAIHKIKNNWFAANALLDYLY